jgi:amino acid adenylation domain-containing protein
LIHDGFLRSAAAFGDRAAVEARDASLTYAELEDRSKSIAATLAAHDSSDGPRLTAVFANRTATGFASVLGVLLRGHGYVPLNVRFPADRCKFMLEHTGCRAIVVDGAAVGELEALLPLLETPLLVVLPDVVETAEYAARWPRHRILGQADLLPASDWVAAETSADDICYILFTSGSTGRPKGVMVAHRNVAAFVDAMVERYAITEEDRFSQSFDLTFDLSVFDLFVAWERGACVCCPAPATLIKPGRFINQAQLTIWFSAPSSGAFMRRLGELKPDSYPTLRWSLFCGEALSTEIASQWSAAAPGSTVENLYGPTELTLACTLYRWDPESSPGESELGVVPIGYPYPDMKALVVDEHLAEVPPGETGELLMAGPQVALGYLGDEEKTAAAFVVPPGTDEIHYRTGDRVRRPAGDGPLTFLGRVDNQIKILGIRVELGEIDAALREVSGVDAALAVGWPRTETGVGGVVGFVGDPDADPVALRAGVAARLPEYMVPREVRLLDEFPLNSNGKFDRKALLEMLEKEGAPR